MEPQIINPTEEDGITHFTLKNINVSLANAIRRVILSDIPTFVFRTSPHDKNKAEFEINTTRMNNELIKQRLSCIPIYINDMDFPYKDYKLEVDVQNDTDIMVYITTNDFKIKNIQNDKYLTKDATNKLFPPHSLTQNYIDLVRLRPKISDEIDGEHLKFSCEFDIGTAREDGMFNVVSTCSYANTPDPVEINKAWTEKSKELKKEGNSSEDIEYTKKDWLLLEGQRYTIPNSFDFVIESIGVFDNYDLIRKACNIMKNKLTTFLQKLQEKPEIVTPANTTIPNSYDIIMEKEGYTLGKVIEYFLYSDYYEKNNVLSYCGFRKPHPHIDISIIRIAFNEEPDNNTIIISHLANSINKAIGIYDLILKEL